MNYGVGCRCSLDHEFLWLWYRPAAVAPIWPLAWEPPYATDVAFKKNAKQQQQKRKQTLRSSPHGSAVTNSTVIHEDGGLIPGLTRWIKGSGVAVSCGVGHRLSWNLMLPWLWHRPAATALMRPLAWEPPYAVGSGLPPPKKKTKQILDWRMYIRNYEEIRLNRLWLNHAKTWKIRGYGLPNVLSWICKFVETESRNIEVTKSQGKKELLFNRYWIYVGMMKKLWVQIVVMVTQHCDCIKCHLL